MGSNHEKNSGTKSRDKLPLKAHKKTHADDCEHGAGHPLNEGLQRVGVVDGEALESLVHFLEI